VNRNDRTRAATLIRNTFGLDASATYRGYNGERVAALDIMRDIEQLACERRPGGNIKLRYHPKNLARSRKWLLARESAIVGLSL
jgi:hypothetical protein